MSLMSWYSDGSGDDVTELELLPLQSTPLSCPLNGGEIVVRFPYPEQQLDPSSRIVGEELPSVDFPPDDPVLDME